MMNHRDTNQTWLNALGSVIALMIFVAVISLILFNIFGIKKSHTVAKPVHNYQTFVEKKK